ncbi:MAG: PEP-CTERM sorting domain-containing protein [Acidobacteria bacterium]|nr:PEP-CTERM sorting domain-containing protein [Acidobacteriota bacterium]
MRFAKLASLLLAATALAPAATITGPFTHNGGLGTVSGSVSGNNIQLIESISAFTPSFVVGYTTPFGPSTNYTVTKTVTNNTGFTWGDFQIATGCGSNQTVACGSNIVNLSSPAGASSSAGGTFSALNSYMFGWTGLNVAPGQTVTFTFDVTTCANCSGGWALSQSATTGVPEPSTTAISGLGLSLVAFSAYRRRMR